MGIRRNAKKYPADVANYVKACILMKADLVHPANLYSKYDEYVAIHNTIQNVLVPGGGPAVNFGHGGVGAYSFLSWHRYFLYRFELQLQTYVPGVTIPYWDWTDPATLMVDSLLGPNGTGVLNWVQQGYFAYNKPGSAATPAAGSIPALAANATALPPWWPAGLQGWRLLDGVGFQAAYVGGLIRSTGVIGALPTVDDLKLALAKTNYRDFQSALETGLVDIGMGMTGAGVIPGHTMHDSVHFWFGAGSHMRLSKVSSFDPLFYMHHANVDRLWAMWQTDGHPDYPSVGAKPQHGPGDKMYPWVGTAAGYTPQFPITGVPVPNFSGEPAKVNTDTLDFRAFGYTYDSIPVIALALDRTGSMNQFTPDPMVVGNPNVSKWEAAKRGIVAFLQDAEAFQESALIYTVAGIKTFRSLPANAFDTIFGGPGYGLVKTGSGFSQSAFNSGMMGLLPGGGTPLADALNNVQTSLVEGAFSNHPAGEQRYMAFLTDGLLTSGAPMSSIPNGSFTNTAIFAMGFGTPAEVDYATLASIVAKGNTLTSQQLFHGENAGTIGKFYDNSLAAAIGFTPVIDPVIELFAGEHTHIDFFATSADDAFYITAQGMDFDDANWSFMLHGPNNQMLYGGNGMSHQMEMCNHCCPPPHITSKRSNGRLTLVIQKSNSENDCWVGCWQLMIAYKTQLQDKMMMPELGELLLPVSAGPVRGLRYARLLIDPLRRIPTRNIVKPKAHRLDEVAGSTNSNAEQACNIVVNVFGRTNLKLELQPACNTVIAGEELKIKIIPDVSMGSIQNGRAFARYVSPAFDIAQILPPERVKILTKTMESTRTESRRPDIGLLLAAYEKQHPGLEFVKDNEGIIVNYEGGPFQLKVRDTNVAGLYHFGIYAEGLYFPDNPSGSGMDMMDMDMDIDMNMDELSAGERFIRILNITVGVVSTPSNPATAV